MPAIAAVRASVLVTDRSAIWVIAAAGVVAVLFAGTGSVVPDAGVIVAVFDSVPVAEAATVAVSVKVIEPPTVMFTVVEIAPVPDATVHSCSAVSPCTSRRRWSTLPGECR